MIKLLNELFEGKTRRAEITRWILLIFDILTVTFFVITTFLPLAPWVIIIDYTIGALLALEFTARTAVARDKLNHLASLGAAIDLIVIISLLAPVLVENFVFLRILRTLRLMRSYHVLKQLRRSSRFFAAHEEIIFAGLNLFVFIFIISALVYALQARGNPDISNYIDALYFTITTLTTTGFGDITLVGSTGRMLAIVIMIVGVSLFLRLVQTIFRPRKVNYECPDCGLARHDADAVHCKHCGRILHISTDGI